MLQFWLRHGGHLFVAGYYGYLDFILGVEAVFLHFEMNFSGVLEYLPVQFCEVYVRSMFSQKQRAFFLSLPPPNSTRNEAFLVVIYTSVVSIFL